MILEQVINEEGAQQFYSSELIILKKIIDNLKIYPITGLADQK